MSEGQEAARRELEKLPGMREDQLRRHAQCSICGKGIGHTGVPLFWTTQVARWGLLKGPLDRNAALTAFFGGGPTGAGLSRVMGADEIMARRVLHEDITLCEPCAEPLMVLAEAVSARRAAAGARS